MKKSFTLIELLIVLIILGVLVTLAVPQYSKILIKVHEIEAKRNLRALADSLWRYYLQNKTFPPYADDRPPYWLPSTIDVTLAHNPTKYFTYIYGAHSPEFNISLYANNNEPDSLPIGSVLSYAIIYDTIDIPDVEDKQKMNEEGMFRYFVRWEKTTTGSSTIIYGWP